MAYTYKNSKGTIYYLHEKKTVLNNGFKRTVYFFAKDQREGYLDAVPEGWFPIESRTGLPFLKQS